MNGNYKHGHSKFGEKGNDQKRNYGSRETIKQTFNETFKDEWIENGIDREAVNFTEKLGKFISNNGMTPSQIRNVFGEIKRIQIKGYEIEKASFYLLKPKFAYAAKRNKSDGINEMKKIFDSAHAAVNNETSFSNFVDFYESILAYHKAFSNKE